MVPQLMVPQVPSGGTFLQQQPDQVGLQAKMLDGGIAYITWHAFEINGTYKITETRYFTAISGCLRRSRRTRQRERRGVTLGVPVFRTSPDYSGSSLPLVSGQNQITTSMIR